MLERPKSISVIALITGLFMAFSFSLVYAWTPWQKKDANDGSSQVASGIIGSQKSSDGNVTVDLTPLSYDDGRLVVKISINTHNVDDLNKYNLKEIIALEIGNDSIKPVKTPRLGGHHNTGNIEFEVKKLPASFVIGITGLDSPGKREFKWP